MQYFTKEIGHVLKVKIKLKYNNNNCALRCVLFNIPSVKIIKLTALLFLLKTDFTVL